MLKLIMIPWIFEIDGHPILKYVVVNFNIRVLLVTQKGYGKANANQEYLCRQTHIIKIIIWIQIREMNNHSEGNLGDKIHRI